MTFEASGPFEALSQNRHLVGDVRSGSGGPTLVAMAALHGNETAGLRAAERVLALVRRGSPPLRGRLVFLAGNLAAIRRHTRYVDTDLNREWTEEKVARLRAGPGPGGGSIEAVEQAALIDAIGRILGGAARPIHFLDLHTSSAEGPPFLTVGDTLRNRRFARHFPLPVILGLEEQIDGSLLEFLNNRGLVTLGVEAGQHAAEDSVDRLEAVLWVALVAAGLLAPGDVAGLDRYRRRLTEASLGIPRVLEVRHRHAIRPADRFRMREGFRNFQPVRRGELLARDRHGDVLSPRDGLILLPLYQGKGDDGFFVAREVHPAWLGISAVVRRLHAGGLLRYLPGVRPDCGSREVLVVDTRLARLYPLEVFHLFGFRKLRSVGVELVVSRRRYDLAPPVEVRFP